MAGILASRNSIGGMLWVFDSLPADNGVAIGVQPGDLMFETTGDHLWIMGIDHIPIALSA